MIVGFFVVFSGRHQLRLHCVFLHSAFQYCAILFLVLLALGLIIPAHALPPGLKVRGIWSESTREYRYGCGKDKNNKWYVLRLGSGKRVRAALLRKQLRPEILFLRGKLKALQTSGAPEQKIQKLRNLIQRVGQGCSASNNPLTPTPTPTPDGGVVGIDPTPPGGGQPGPGLPTPTITPSSTPTSGFTPTPVATATPTAIPPPGSWPTTSLTGNCIAVMHADSYTTSLVPVHLARPFIQGEIPEYPTALENGQIVPTQANVQSRWNDGSVKHAILVFYISLQQGQTKTICFGNQNQNYTTGGLTQNDMLAPAWNFDARTSISASTGGSTASARSALQAGDYQTWISGLAATSVVIGDRQSADYDLGVGGARPVKPMWYVTFYPIIGAAKVRFTGETTNSQALGDLNYDLSLQLGAAPTQTVYQKSQHMQYARTVWTKEFWLGNRPPRIAIKQNLPYLSATKMLPNYNPNISVDTTRAIQQCNNWLNAPKNLGDRGQYLIDMGSAGGRLELGLLPAWTVMYLYTGSPCLAESMYGHADLSGSWPMFLREGDSSRRFDRNLSVPGIGKFLSIYSRPSFWINGNAFNGSSADQVIMTGTLANNPWKVDWAHMPEPFAVPWLLSGDKFYLEMLQGQTLSNIIGRQPGNNWLTRGPYQCFNIGTTGQTRQDAWLIRSMATAAAFSPDNTPEKTELYYRVECMLSAWAGAHNITNPYPAYQASWNWGNTSVRNGTGGTDCGLYGSQPYPQCRNPFSSSIRYWAAPSGVIVSGHVNSPTVVMPWQYYYLIIGLARAKELGFNTEATIDWVGKFATDLLLTPGYDGYLSGEYYFPVHDPSTNEYLSNLAQAQALYTSERINGAQSYFIGALGGVDHSYSIILGTALEMMGTTGQAQDARTRYNQLLLENVIPFWLNPQWAVVRRN